jgi:hypothetical protein
LPGRLPLKIGQPLKRNVVTQLSPIKTLNLNQDILDKVIHSADPAQFLTGFLRISILVTKEEPGDHIILTGIIYKEDGITPDSGITMFVCLS